MNGKQALIYSRVRHSTATSCAWAASSRSCRPSSRRSPGRAQPPSAPPRPARASWRASAPTSHQPDHRARLPRVARQRRSMSKRRCSWARPRSIDGGSYVVVIRRSWPSTCGAVPQPVAGEQAQRPRRRRVSAGAALGAADGAQRGPDVSASSRRPLTRKRSVRKSSGMSTREPLLRQQQRGECLPLEWIGSSSSGRACSAYPAAPPTRQLRRRTAAAPPSSAKRGPAEREQLPVAPPRIPTLLREARPEPPAPPHQARRADFEGSLCRRSPQRPGLSARRPRAERISCQRPRLLNVTTTSSVATVGR